MNNTPNHDTLWDYLDGLLTAEERRAVEVQVQQHPEWQQALSQIKAQRNGLSQLPFESPRAGFADRVMANWVAEQAADGKLLPDTPHRDWMIQAISWTFAVLLLAPIAIMLVTGLGMSIQTPQTLTDAIAQQTNEMPAFSLEHFMSNAVVQIVLYLALGMLAARLGIQWLRSRLVTVKA